MEPTEPHEMTLPNKINLYDFFRAAGFLHGIFYVIFLLFHSYRSWLGVFVCLPLLKNRILINTNTFKTFFF